MIAVQYYPDSGIHFSYEIQLCFWIYFTINLQEFHDIIGDKRSRRKTLVLMFDKSQQELLRVLTALFLSTLSAFMVLSSLIQCPCSRNKSIVFFGLIHCVLALVMSFRLCFIRSQSADIMTYKICYILSAVLLWIYFASHNSSCSSTAVSLKPRQPATTSE